MTSDSTEYQATQEQKQRFWQSFLLALQAEPRNATEIKGASGVTHPAVAVGVDDIRRRIVVISRDPQPRAAALAQFDIQAAHPAYNVIVARPISINLARAATAIASVANTHDLGRLELEALSKAAASKDERLTSLSKGIFEALKGFEWAIVDLTAAWQDAVEQLSHTSVSPAPPDPTKPDEPNGGVLHVGELATLDPAAADRALGNCPIPLYDFAVDDAEILHRGANVEAVRDVLRRMHLFQYFYPAPDQLLLGIAEQPANRALLSRAIAQTPPAGHPFGELELLPHGTRLDELVDALHDRQLLVTGEVGYELTETGRLARAAIKFKPREGLFAKLARLLSVKIDMNLKDLFR